MCIINHFFFFFKWNLQQLIQLDILYKKILRTFFAKDNSYGNRRDKYLLNHSIHIYSHLSQQTGNIHAKRSYQLLNIFLRITICTTNHSIVIKQYEIRLDQEIEKIHSLASFPLPLNSKGNELFQQRSPSRAHIPGTTATHPSRRRREERERGGLGRSMITPSYYLDAVELLCPMRLAERRDNAVLGFLPIRITAAIVPSSRGHRRRQKEAARGSSFPERAPLCPRDYELASISWMEHPSSSPPLPRIMGGWCTHYCDVVATIRFRNRVPYRDARERAFLVRRRRRQKFSSGYNTGLLFDESRWFIAWFAMCTFFFFPLSF